MGAAGPFASHCLGAESHWTWSVMLNGAVPLARVNESQTKDSAGPLRAGTKCGETPGQDGGREKHLYLGVPRTGFPL